jgi:hypothetical protein
MGKTENVKVLWIPRKLLFTGRPVEALLGVCLHSKRIFMVATSYLEPLIVHDILLDETLPECEEGQRCLNLSCKFNKTTQKTIGRKMTKAMFEKLPIEKNWPPELVTRLEEYCDKNPDGGILRATRKKK